jgi:hypothetical protein
MAPAQLNIVCYTAQSAAAQGQLPPPSFVAGGDRCSPETGRRRPRCIAAPQIPIRQVKRAESEFLFRCYSDPEMDGPCATKVEIGHSAHSIDAYQTRSICIRLAPPGAKICWCNSPLFSLNRPSCRTVRRLWPRDSRFVRCNMKGSGSVQMRARSHPENRVKPS